MADNTILYRVGVIGTEEQNANIGKLKTQIDVLTDSINKTRQTLRGLDVTWKEFMDKRMAEGEHNHAVIAKEWAEYKKVQLAKIDLNTEANKKLTVQLGGELNQRNQLNAQLSQSLKSTTDKVQANTFEEGSIMQLRQALAQATKQYDLMGAAERTAAGGKALETSIQEQMKALSALEQKTGRFQRNVGNYASGFNGLANSINQVTRELPNFAQSATIGFMALSNNLPILAEEITRVRLANEALVKSGKTSIPVWKQVISSLFTWQSALITLISLSVIYAKEISNFFSGTSKAAEEAKKSNDEYAKSLKDIGKAASDSAIKDKVMMQTWVDTAQNAEAAMTNRIDAVKKLQETYPETFGLLTQNAILEGDLANAIKHTTDMLYAKARAETAVNSGIEAEKRLKDLKEIKKSIEDEFRKSTDTKIGTTSAELLTAALFIDEDVYAKLIDVNQRILSASKDTIKFRKEAEAAFETDMPSGAGKDGSSKAAKEKEKRDKELLDLEREYQRLLIENKYEGFAEELKLAEKANEWEIEDLKASKDKLLKTDLEGRAKYDKLIQAKETEHQIKIHEIKQKWIGLNRELNAKARDEEFKANTKIQEELSKERQKALADAMKGVDEYEKWKEAQAKKEHDDNIKAEQAAKDESIKLATQTSDAIFKIKQDAIDRQNKMELTAIQRNADAQQTILENRLRNGIISEGQYNDDVQRLNQETAARELEANRKAFDENKRLSKLQAVINGALAITAVMANSKDPTGILTAIQVGAVTAATAIQVKSIDAQQYALGGKIKGKSHAQGGVMINAEEDEAVINKQAMRSNQVMSLIGTPSQITSAVNSTYGGVSWESGAITSRPSPTLFSNSTQQQSITYEQMLGLIQLQTQSINDKKVILVESDVTKTQKRVISNESNGRFWN